MTTDEKARIAVETYHEHCGRCAACRKSCGCPHCEGSPSRKCGRGKVLMEVAADTTAGAMTEAPRASW